ncbi:hypothetical protein DPMN_166673 [Dreissena polymorpha]|uniref:Uncharacterized protein n=1 Tax=Dreissena polymorpha TaxID=45954 RepID=A0A9D4EZ20_DREPO|nr:hypothetical protein DPMN_166673 [Dreissena polymorpha]
MVPDLLSSNPSHHTGWFPTCCQHTIPIIQDGPRLAVIIPFPSYKDTSLLKNGYKSKRVKCRPRLTVQSTRDNQREHLPF